MNSIKNLFILLISILFFISCESDNGISSRKFTGTKFVHIHKFYFESSPKVLVADTIQFFTGEDASIAYQEDYQKEIDETTFYIRNKNIDSLKFGIAENLNIDLKTINSKNTHNDNVGNDIKRFADLFNSEIQKYYSSLPFKLSFNEGKVYKIEEVYIP
jgi:hypothetical protein